MLTFGIVGGAYCATSELPDCLKDIGKNEGLFLKPLRELVGNNTLDQKFIDNNKTKYWEWVHDFILYGCKYDYDQIPQGSITVGINDIVQELRNHLKSDEEWNNALAAIADRESITIPFELNNQKYDIAIDTNRVFDYMDFYTAILVTDKTNKGPGDTIKKSDIPRGQHFFSSDCSTYNPAARIPDNAPVNKAGQRAFGSENEYFLDQPVGLNYRSFPGLVIKDIPAAMGGWFGSEQVLAFNNYKTGYTAMKKFAESLQNTACRGLAVYLVRWPRGYPPEIGSLDLSFTPPDLEDDIDEFEILSDPEIIR